jgi:hypothetical protein
LQEFEEELRDEGVRFHDLTPLFQGETQDLYVDWCCHLNRAGYELVARRIAEEILASWNERAAASSDAGR